MESKGISMEGSVIVPCVQELAKEPLATVPPRYVRPDQDPILVSDSSTLQIPVIDLQKLVAGEFMESELEKLHFACKEWGFFQLINHGVRDALLDTVKEEMHALFNLPMEEKKRFWQRDGHVEGFGHAFVVSEDQKLDWGDLFGIFMQPMNLRKPHLLPCLPPRLRDGLEEYSAETKRVAVEILSFMEKALKMESGEITALFEDGFQGMRMNYYPPCPQPESVIGLSPHSDAGGLTLLLQANETEGLQIRKDGNWVSVKPLPSAFIINIADALEIVTNGIYRSIEHRAVVNSSKERLSIATFCDPRMDAEIGPSSSLVTPTTPPLFRRIQYGDYLKGYLSRELNRKSYVDLLRLPNQ